MPGKPLCQWWKNHSDGPYNIQLLLVEICAFERFSFDYVHSAKTRVGAKVNT